jgi:hypothetical protein
LKFTGLRSWLCLVALLSGTTAYATEPGQVTFESSDKTLTDGFAWAKKQALSYVHRGDAVGDWYDASLPKRDAFCMRDVSHQTLGAQILGLADVTRNLLEKFARNIKASRQWCSFWEITKDNKPAPVDYKNDQDFWYNLPANFDVLHACYRQYLWTGDRAYLSEATFLNFYRRTTHDYVAAWDVDGDGIPDGLPSYGRRGIPSYNEQMAGHPRQAADLLATEYSALAAAAQIQRLMQHTTEVEQLTKVAEHVRSVYNRQWWNAGQTRFYTAKLQDGTFSDDRVAEADIFPVYLEQLPEDGERLRAQLRLVSTDSENPKLNVETFSYFPEVLYRWGLDEAAYRSVVKLVNPSLPRREYPEVSFAAVGAFAAGLMGIQPDAARHVVATQSHLTRDTSWAALSHVPVFDGDISVRHLGLTETRFTNGGHQLIHWEARFSGSYTRLLINDRATAARRKPGISYSLVDVAPGATVSVRLPADGGAGTRASARE